METNNISLADLAAAFAPRCLFCDARLTAVSGQYEHKPEHTPADGHPARPVFEDF